MSNSKFPRWFVNSLSSVIRRFDGPDNCYFVGGARDGNESVFSIECAEWFTSDGTWRELTEDEVREIKEKR